jgi:hypothetical protein
MAPFITLMDEVEVGIKRGKSDILEAGQVVEMRGLYDDEEDAGVAVGVVVRVHTEVNTFHVKFIEAADASWSWHLFDRPGAPSSTLVKLMRKWGDAQVKKTADGTEIEWIASWRVVAGKGEDVELSGLPWLSSAGKVNKSIEFIREWMCSDKVGVKATFPLKVYKAIGQVKRNYNKWEPVGYRFRLVEVLVWFVCGSFRSIHRMQGRT